MTTPQTPGSSQITLRPAQIEDAPLILSFIQGLAEYERLESEMVATEDHIRQTLFEAEKPAAEVVLAFVNDNTPAGFALFFASYSTFLGKPGIYLEDLFVLPNLRGQGVGKKLLAHLAKLTIERQGGRLEWSVLDWNEPAIKFYESLGAIPMTGWTVNRLTGAALSNLATN